MEKTPFWKKTWFMILAFIFLPPLGIILMWLNKSKWKAFIKIPISIMLAFWSLILGIAFFSPADESAVTESETAAVKEADLNEQTTNKPATATKPDASTTRPERTTETATENTTEQQTATNKETTTAKPTTTKPTTKSPTTAKPTTTTKTTTTKKETTTAKPTTTRPTTTKTPTTVDPESYITVYITKSGEKYHYENPCGNGTYSPISLADAKASGYGACEKCVLH